MAFNLKDYETVKERKLRLRKEHPTAVIIPTVISPLELALEFVVVRAEVWIDRERYRDGPPDSAGLSLSLAGGPGADKTAWMENCEESAIGRALDNLGFYGDKNITKPKCSREEIEKSQHTEKIMKEKEEEAPKPILVEDKESAENVALIARFCIVADFISKVHGDDDEFFAYSKYLSKTRAGMTTYPRPVELKRLTVLTKTRRETLEKALEKMLKEYPSAEKVLESGLVAGDLDF